MALSVLASALGLVAVLLVPGDPAGASVDADAVSGRILDQAGFARPSAQVALLKQVAGADGPTYVQVAEQRVDASARYRFDHLDPTVDYTLAALDTAVPEPRLTTYYRGTQELARAQTFRVGAAEVVADLQLADSGYGTITGTLVDPQHHDGDPTRRTYSVLDGVTGRVVADGVVGVGAGVPSDGFRIALPTGPYTLRLLDERSRRSAPLVLERTLTTDGLALGALTLSARVPSAPSIGVQDDAAHAYCDDHEIDPVAGGGTSVDLPFPVHLGTVRTSRVRIEPRGGHLLLGDPPAFDPRAAFAAGQDVPPVIAPFLAGVDTTDPASGSVTYGVAPAGDALCVVWHEVGYGSAHADRRDTFQVVLARASGDGTTSGDVDVTFGYDAIAWDAADLDGGVGGLAGATARAAVVGVSAGSASTAVRLPGSGVPGALLDGGPDALVAGTRGSGGAPGRHLVEVRDGVPGSSAVRSVAGVVLDESGAPVPGAVVVVCARTDARDCRPPVVAGDGGAFAVDGLTSGQYLVRASPPAGSTLGTLRRLITLAPGSTSFDVPLVLPASPPPPLPPQQLRFLSSGGVLPGLRLTSTGVPILFYRAPIAVEVRGCPGSSGRTALLVVDGTTAGTVDLVEDPADPGVYRGRFDAPFPLSGYGVLQTNVAPCGSNGAGAVEPFYVDPSGSVTDQFGLPLTGASVTLARSDAADGTPADVPDGSALMSPMNRANPSTTGADGAFGWDVLPGFYRLTASHAGCASLTTDALAVPPARFDLVLPLVCRGTPRPATGPRILGAVGVGRRLVARDAAWLDGVPVIRREWRRGSASGPVVGTDRAYVPTVRDAGRRLVLVTIARRPAVHQGGDPDAPLVRFAELRATTSTAPVLAPTRLLVTRLRASGAPRLLVRAVVAGLRPGGRAQAEVAVGGRSRRVVGTLRGGRAVLTLPRLAPGRHVVTVTYRGDVRCAPARRTIAVVVR
ncbi:carboxypeptidase regulatory-like domain-containing protein [Nocardioides sp. TRM66260-LWL]|uniref:nidogen-like domain-containing protein n=1 Tax=Nocardioides sp. TRM66260-LWL TaxID=2874478 RepID=UPI001CC3C177|nr:carboxypeptidase regulatory-like domain-containing protein [Nocardioides sp. TRM66260-LWL]MBZ5734844.1 carboxypeptidase regulatory-like domain-containing protein [Nocardioides sp. TRM66260-LWL]